MTRRIFCALSAFVVVVVSGCAQPPKQLYMWESFPKQQYDSLLRDGASGTDQIRAMEVHAEKARAAGAALPPGFRGHLGMLQLSVGNEDQARQLWQAERIHFPEASPYIDQLLKRLEPKSVKNENPA